MRTEVAKVEKVIEVTVESGTRMRQVPTLEVDPGDTVLLQAGSDTISVWFPEPGVFATTEIVTMQTGNIEVSIPAGAAPGRYEYSIYVHSVVEPVEEVSRYAKSNSHPVMIVSGP